MFEQISARIWRYHDMTGSTSYLVVGDTGAAMVDCGMVPCAMMGAIRRITPLPVRLLLTHAHPDHYGAAAEFDEVWLHEADCAALPVFEEAFSVMRVPPLDRERLHAFSDGQVFDLGGVQLTACHLPGHTPGSTLFVCEGEQCIFCGDAVGSGDIVLMSVPLAYTLSAYRDSLRAYLDKSAPWSAYTYLPGHWHQQRRADGTENPPCRALIEDMESLCCRALSGEIQGEETEEIFAPDRRALRAYAGRAGIVFAAGQRR